MRKLGLITAFALAGSLGACGGAKDETPAATETAATAETAAAPAAATPAATAAAVTADSTDTLDGTKLADMTGDAAKGATTFLQCKTCHVLDAGVNHIGPSLHGMVGRHSGEIPGFAYSTANKNSGITWSPEKLYQYLEKPSRVVPGTKMAFAGLSTGQDRADVIAYLQTASK